MCAAPGGKTFTMAEMMCGEGRVIACDLHEKRVGLIKSGAERLGIDIIEALKNKPEIKYTKLSDIARLPEIQYEILKSSAEYLKDGGELVYSTCTLNRKENDGVIDRFLAETKGFEAVGVMDSSDSCKMTIFPEQFDCEGFFISKIRKVGR